MLRNPMLLAMLLLTVTASRSVAENGVSLSWDNCAGPFNKSITGGATADVYISVLGQSQVSQAYEVVTFLSPATVAFPDAWRFDPTGCEGSTRIALNHLAPAAVAGSCPSFQGAFQSVQIKDYEFDTVSNKVRIVLADAYPNMDPATGVNHGNPGAVNPAQRYFLADYHFDFTSANAGPSPVDLSTCGGVEAPMCFMLTMATWVDLNGEEIPWAWNSGYLTANDPQDRSHCPSVVPVVAKTWGSLKSQYRN
jgi:hypothetical protein